MKCSYHVDREAVSECSSCGKPLCGECAVSGRDGKNLCSRCIALSSAQEALRGMDRRLEERDARKRGLEERKGRRERLWVFAQWGLIFVCLAVLAFQAPGAISGFKETNRSEKDPTPPMNPQIGASPTCGARQNFFRKAKPRGSEILCPESNRPYVVSMAGEECTARCPNPERHRVKEIRVSLKRPVPEVIP